MADKRFVAKNGLDNNSQTITNVADPANAQDAATKSYVDAGTATLTNKTIDSFTNRVGADHIHYKVKAGASITKGQTLKVTGYHAGEQAIEVVPISSSADIAVGIAHDNLASGEYGLAINTGLLTDVKTDYAGWAAGDILYPDPATGGLTKTKPSSGTYQACAYVIRVQANNGVLLVEFTEPQNVAASTNTASTVVQRDASGNFSAGTITASLSGNASTVTNGVYTTGSYSDPSWITALAASKLTGTTLPSSVVTSSLTSVGTIGTGTWQGTAITDTYLATITTAGKVANSATTATSANTASAIVARDASGNFTAGTITAALSGNATTATTLQTARSINGVSFNGSADITVTAAAGTLTGTTLASNVVTSSLTTVGTIATGVWQGTAIANTYIATGLDVTKLTTGATLPSNVLASSLTSVGTLSSLTVSGAITGATSTNTINGLIISSGGLGGSTGVKFGIGTAFSNGQAEAYTTSTTPMGIGTVGSAPLRFYTNSALVGVLDASGNLGLGVTPSAWSSTDRAIQIADNGAAISSWTTGATGAGYLFLNNNAHFDGTNWIYRAARGTAQYRMNNAVHSWYNAPSGTAGTAISLTQAMTLDASGRLGIGSTSPSSALVVAAAATTDTTGAANKWTMRLQDTTSAAANVGGSILFQGYKTGTSAVGNYGGIAGLKENATSANEDGYLAFFTVSNAAGGTLAERARIDSSGNVGIGTSSPLGKLGITGSATTTIIIPRSSNGTTATPVETQLIGSTFTNGTFEAGIYALNSFTNTSANWLTFKTTDAGNATATRMTLDSSGNLGLGVTPNLWGSTFKPLQLGIGASIFGRTASITQVHVAANVYYDDSDARYEYIGTGLASRYYQASGSHVWETAASGTANAAISFTQAMQLDASGNLGVGTTSPAARFEVSTSTTDATVLQEVLRVSTTGRSTSSGTAVNGRGALLTFSDASNFTLTAAIGGLRQAPSGHYNGDLAFYTNASGGVASSSVSQLTERMRISSNGDVGIGESIPDYRVAIKSADSTASTYAIQCRNSSSTVLFFARSDGYIGTGTASISPYNYTTGSAANLWVGASGELMRSTSSLRYKSNVQDATFGLAEVLALRPVTYQAKNSGDTVFGGLIAEEVDAAGLSPFVVYDTEGRPDALHYGNMVALLTKAIQELKATNDALEARLAALES